MARVAAYSILIDWNNDGDFSDTGENVSSRVLGVKTPVSFSYGRDTARSLAAVTPAQLEMELNNRSKDYSPGNASSPLVGLLGPGKPVKMQAVHNSITYDLFRGYIDQYEITPSLGDRSVKLSCVDLLTRLGEVTLSTELYRSLQTHEAIGVILDLVGWPAADRDIDPGATTLRWWWMENETAAAGLAKIVDAEGPPALCYVSPAGVMTFRSRHHRILRTASKAVQATFRSRDTDTEPRFADGMTYDIGWRDLVNDVTLDVDERRPEDVSPVWTTEDVFSLAAGQSIVFSASASDPFIEAVVPEEDIDYVVLSGAVNVALSRTSGQSATITVTATSNATIQGMALRGRPVSVLRTVQVQVQDTESIEQNGIRTLQDAELALAGRNDVEAIGRVIIGQRAKRLPIVTISVNNGNDTRMVQVLTRALSDRIKIVEPEQTFLDDEFFIEQIQHSINDVGRNHVVTFGCEQCPADVGATPNYFTFDSATAGLSEGVFAQAGVTFDPDVFILGDATNGQLGNNGLGF